MGLGPIATPKLNYKLAHIDVFIWILNIMSLIILYYKKKIVNKTTIMQPSICCILNIFQIQASIHRFAILRISNLCSEACDTRMRTIV